MYKSLIKQYTTKLFDSYFFNLALTYYVKKGDFDTIKEIIENTNWKTEKNMQVVKICAVVDYVLYKKPSYKLFNFLFSHVSYSDSEEHFGFKITGQDIKKYDLHKVIDNCLSTDKFGFLNKLLKNYSHFNLVEHTLESCIKTYKNEFCIKYYELHKSVILREKIIAESIKNKNVSMLEFISKNHNIFNCYSVWQAEKYPDKPNQHYHTYHKRYFEIMEIKNPITDNIIITYINAKDFSICLKYLLNKNRNKIASEWLDKLNQNKLSFQIKDVNILKDIKVNIEKLSLKSLLIYYHLTENKKVFEDSPLLSDYRYVENINHKILNAISHNKLGYLNKIKTEFKLKNVLYNSFLINSYYTQMSLSSIKLDNELEPLSLEKK